MKFLHTADWQIGMRAHHAGARAEAIRQERLRTIGRIVDLANERRVDFMMVAGDQFEDAAPELREIASVVAELRRATMPVFVLPGNHDPATMASPYTSAAWRVLAGSNVTTVWEPAIFEVAGAVLLAAPCDKKYSVQDPTLCFQEMPTPDGMVRVGCAHGTLAIGAIVAQDEGDQRGGYPISLNSASRAGLTYLGLGHWHSYYEHMDSGSLIAYSGTPEPTRFADRDCGTVSIVEIDGPRAAPKVERVRVAGLTWLERRFDILDDESFDGAVSTLRAIPDQKRTVVRAVFRGVLSPDQMERAAVERATFNNDFFAYEDCDELDITPANTDAWLRTMPPGLALEIAQRLVTELSGDKSTIALSALVKLRKALS